MYMNKRKLLITDHIDETGLAPLEQFFTVEKRFGITASELQVCIPVYDAIITRSPTAVSQELIRRGKKLSIIARAAIGVDNIDIQEATQHRIAVINAPKGNARSTAEHTIGLLFALLRHIPQANADLKRNIWGKQKYVGTQVAGKTLGIIGFGNVGKEVYALAKGLGMRVIVCEPYITLPKSVKKTTLESLLAEADIVTLHVPATYLTKKLINTVTLSLMKPGAFLLNASRGAVVDETAVLRALNTQRIAGFAQDVFTKEPPVIHDLLLHPNVVATPHIAGSTRESQLQSVHEIVTGIVHYCKGEMPHNLLNPQVFHKKKSPKKTQAFDAIIFDCDSTLCTIEATDELAAMVGKRMEITKITTAAMEGSIPFDEAYTKRLALIRPTREHLTKLGHAYIANMSLHAKDVVGALKLLGKKLYIISGSYWEPLRMVAEFLDLPDRQVFGNDLLFDSTGQFEAIVEGPLIRNHGKLQILRQIPGKKLFIGDGITDLEAKEVVDLFVGYGGVARRKSVEQSADVYIKTKTLLPALAIGAGLSGCKDLMTTPYRKLIGKSIDHLFHEKDVTISQSFLQKLDELRELAYY